MAKNKFFPGVVSSISRVCAAFIGIVAVISVVSGCGGAGGGPKPRAKLESVAFNEKGSDAFRKGDMKKALHFHKEALRYNLSMDNVRGAAIELLNISIVLKRMKRYEQAAKRLNEAFALAEAEEKMGVSRYPNKDMNKILAKAAMVMSLIHIRKERLAMAEKWSQRAQDLCRAGGCQFEGRIRNVLGRVAYKQGNIVTARKEANTALELNTKRQDQVEIANSLRMLGDTASDLDTAMRFYIKALAIDRDYGDGMKISTDLVSIGRIFADKGDMEQASLFYQRGLMVSKAAGDLEAAKRIETTLDALGAGNTQ